MPPSCSPSFLVGVTSCSAACSSTRGYAFPRRAGSPGATSRSSRAFSMSAGQLAPLEPGEVPRIVPPKSSRGVRTVPLLPRLQVALEALYAGEDDAAFVLRTCRGTPLSRHNARRSITEAGKGAKLGRVTPHTLLRSTGTALSEARVRRWPPRRSWSRDRGLSRDVSEGPSGRARAGSGRRGIGRARTRRCTGVVRSEPGTQGSHCRQRKSPFLRGFFDAPGRNRTYDLWLRRPALYPLSYERVSQPV